MTVAISPQYELSFLVGEVARNDVYAESEARLLWHAFHRLSPGSEMPRELGRLIREVRKRLNDSTLPPPFAEIAREVVDALAKAHKTRNELVHDQWVQALRRPEEIRSARSSDARTLTDLRECAEQLKIVTWRLRGVWIIAEVWLDLPSTPDADVNPDAEDLHSWTRVAMGHIADVPGVTLGTPGPAPLPPGYESAGSREEWS